MKIALHESISLVDGDVRRMATDAARSSGFEEVEIIPFNAALDLLEEMTPSKGHIIDLVIAPVSLPDANMLDVLAEMRVEIPLVYSVIVDESAERAAAASEAAVDGYLVKPVTSGRFQKELGRIFTSIERLYAASFVVNSMVGERRLAFHAVLYSETDGHDQVLALEDGRSLNVRCSSQALFEQLSRDGRFFKVGSSYIVNLNEVLEFNTPAGTLTLSNGTRIAVPFRSRKALENTLLDWR